MMDAGKTIVVCDNCSTKFPVKIQKCSVEIEDNQLILEYFACPECNQIYKIFLVEEQRYQELVDDLLSTEKRIQKWNGKGNEKMLEQLQKMVLKKESRLQNYVKSISTKYNGTFTFMASENNQKEIVYLP